MISRRKNVERKPKLFSFGKNDDYNNKNGKGHETVHSQMKIHKCSMKMGAEKQFNISGDQRITKPSNTIPCPPDTPEKTLWEQEIPTTGKSLGKRAL